MICIIQKKLLEYFTNSNVLVDTEQSMTETFSQHSQSRFNIL